MHTRNEITAQIQFIATVNSLVQSYQEISVTKMQKVRGSVLQTREFLVKLSDVFHDVRENYKSEIEKLTKKNKNPQSITSFQTGIKNGKTVSVLLSSNTKLYGSIIKEVFDLFISNIEKSDTDLVVIGRVGKELFEGYSKNRKYEYFELPDSMVSMEDLRGVTELVLKYEKVYVYHGKFINIFTQSPTVSNVTGDQPADSEGQSGTDQDDPEKTAQQKQHSTYFFEPSLETVMNLFGNQVLGSLFKQSIHEGELSKLASRIRAMEDAHGKIEKERLDWLKRQSRQKKLTMNKKQLESFSGISIWGK